MISVHTVVRIMRKRTLQDLLLLVRIVAKVHTAFQAVNNRSEKRIDNRSLPNGVEAIPNILERSCALVQNKSYIVKNLDNIAKVLWVSMSVPVDCTYLP